MCSATVMDAPEDGCLSFPLCSQLSVKPKTENRNMISNGRVGTALFLVAFLLLSKVGLTFGQEIEVKDILFAADDTTMRGTYWDWDKDGFYHKDQDVQFSIVYERVDFDTVSGFLTIFSEDKFFETVGDTIRGDTTWVLLGGTVLDRDPADPLTRAFYASILMDSSKVNVDDDGGVIRFDITNRADSLFKPPDALVNNQVNVISIDPYDDGVVWIGTNGGISRYKGGAWESFTTSNNDAITNNVILAIAISKSDVWFGTRGGGLLRWDKAEGSWSRYDTENSRLTNDQVSAIAIQSDSIWIGTLESGIDLFDSRGNKWEYFGGFPSTVKFSSFSDSLITSIAIDGKGNKWIGTAGGGIARFNEHKSEGERWRVLREVLGDTLGYNYVNAIVVDTSSGDIWVGTESAGAFQIRSGVLTSDSVTVYKHAFRSQQQELIDNTVKSIAIDSTGSKWFATPKGVSKLNKEGHWEQFTYDDFGGFGSNIWAIAVTDSIVWLGRRPTKYSQVVWDVNTVSFGERTIIPDLKVRVSFIDNFLEVVAPYTFTDPDSLVIDNEPPRVRNLWPNSRSEGVPADSVSISAFVDDATLGLLGIDTIILKIDKKETILKVVADSLKKDRVLKEGGLRFPVPSSSRWFFDGTQVRHNNLTFPVRLEEGMHNIRLEVFDRAGHRDTTDSRFTVVEATEGENISELINYPNPFAIGSGGTIIRYVLGRPSYVTLRIFDVSGALVDRIVEDQLRNAGSHDEVWDGRDFFGRELSNGVYFCELVAIEQETRTEHRKYTKIAILR